MHARPRSPLTSALRWALAAAFLIGGCTNFFKPRAAQPPSRAGVLSDYSDPDSTLATLARAIEAKAGGNASTVYRAGLADSIPDGQYFFAYFDPAAAALWLSVSTRPLPDPWDIELESRFFSKLPELAGAKNYDFEWLLDTYHPHDEDLGIGPNGRPSRLLHRQYLLLGVPPSGVGTTDTLSIGYADLTFIQSRTTSNWVISRWQDRVDLTFGVNPSNGSLVSFSTRRLGFY